MIVHVMGIDPGTVNLGVAILGYDRDTGDVVSVFSRNINAYKLHRSEPYHPLNRDQLNAKIRTKLMTDQLDRIVDLRDPDYLAIEAPFASMGRVSTFSVLTIHFNALLDMGYNNRLDTYTYPPTTVKKTFNCAGKKGKWVMREALGDIDELYSVLEKPLDSMSEHEVDAVAVCYTALLRARKGELE